METTERSDGDVTVLEVIGDIDLESSPGLRQQLKKYSSTKTSKVLLDFSGVGYIDSSGLATIVEFFQSIQSYKGKLAIGGVNTRIRNSFEIVRLHEILSLHADVPAAAAALAS